MTLKPGSKNLITDVPGLNVGNAEDYILKSGVSVLTSSNPMTASYCVMGGAPGTRETDLLEPDKTVHGIDAIVLSGGSAFGLDATNGVVEYLREQGKGFAMGPFNVPIVPTAIIFPPFSLHSLILLTVCFDICPNSACILCFSILSLIGIKVPAPTCNVTCSI